MSRYNVYPVWVSDTYNMESEQVLFDSKEEAEKYIKDINLASAIIKFHAPSITKLAMNSGDPIIEKEVSYLLKMAPDLFNSLISRERDQKKKNNLPALFELWADTDTTLGTPYPLPAHSALMRDLEDLIQSLPEGESKDKALKIKENLT